MCHVAHTEVSECWRNLAEIHAAPEWLWSGLVKAMVDGGWTVATTRDKVGAVKEIAEPPKWADAAAPSPRARGLTRIEINLSFT